MSNKKWQFHQSDIIRKNCPAFRPDSMTIHAMTYSSPFFLLGSSAVTLVLVCLQPVPSALDDTINSHFNTILAGSFERENGEE